jgi:hypothetical protein
MTPTARLKFAQQIVIDILSADQFLREIPPLPFIVESENADEKAPTSLTVKAELTGRSIGILSDYTITVTMDRVFRDEDVSEADADTLWEKVNTQIDDWYAVFLGLPIRPQVNHLTIDPIDFSEETEVSDQHDIRVRQLQMFLKET